MGGPRPLPAAIRRVAGLRLAVPRAPRDAGVAVIALLLRVLFLVRANAVRPATWKHNACFILGGVYFAVMAFRLVAGLTFLADVEWFSHTLPALFHVVLTTFILLFGHYLYRLGKRAP